MSSEALERAEKLERIRYELTLPCQSQFIRSDVEWLLAEVARLEQERDDWHEGFRQQADLLREKDAELAVARERAETAERERDEALRLVTMMRATESTVLAVARERAEQLELQRDEAREKCAMARESAALNAEEARSLTIDLAVAREREQRLRIALQDAQGIALNGTDRADSNSARLLAIDAVVTAALADEPAAAPDEPTWDEDGFEQAPAAATLAEPEARTRGGEEVPHERAASSVCGPQNASGSASAAADEPMCCPRCGNETTEADLTYSGCGVCRAEAAAADLVDAAADEPGEAP